MVFDKSKYVGMNFSGFEWAYFDKGIHTFSKKIASGYVKIECSEEQLTNGDIEFMAESNITIGVELKRKIQNRWKRANP